MYKLPQKAYKNLEFLNSADARIIRMLAEFLEPQSRFNKLGIKDTIVFFGSARFYDGKTAQKMVNQIKKTKNFKDKNLLKKIKEAEIALEMSKYYDDAVTLSKMLTEWSLNLPNEKGRFVICSGGGPGVMEAAGKGARLAKGKTIGMNISIPTEQFINKYVSPELGFEFHYFFMRKFWLAYLAKALVTFPGGFGTMDELFEILTLVQTGKISKKIKIIMYGEEFWKNLINFDYLVDTGCISENDLNNFQICNTPQEAFDHLTDFLKKNYLNKNSEI